MQDLLGIGTNRRESMIGTGIGLGLAGYRLNPPGVLPVLDLRFATDKSLTAFAGPTPSFSRASSGTYFDANGVLQSAGVNAARFNHVYNGTSWVSKGLLIEEQRTNLILYSNLQSSWYSVNATLSATTETTSPDGTNNSRKLTEDTTASTYHYAEILSGSPSVSGGVTYTASCFVKANGRTKFYISSGTNRINMTTYFDLSNGTITSSSASSSSITNVGNGWYRCTATQTASATGATSFQLVMADDSSNPVYTGDGIKGVFIFGYQVEQATFALSLIPTTSASVTRSADVCQISGSDFSGFWNQLEGTFAAECDVNGFNASGVNYIGVASVGSISQYAFVGRFNGSLTALNFQVYNGSPFGDITYTTASATPTKTAFGIKANDCAASVNGGAVSTDNTATMTTALNQLEIGNFLGANHLNGHISRLSYYRTRLENGTLRVLST